MTSQPSRGAPPFRPAWYCPGAHLQSAWGYFFRKRPRIDWRRERWETPDGDFLEVDFLDAEAPDAPTLLILHGLEGSSASHYARGAAARARALGWRAAALNFRSCGGAPNLRPRFYHCGETGDLAFAAERILERFDAPLALAGFSLGGSVLLRWLGERGEGVSPRVRGAVCVSASFQPGVCARALDSPAGWLYRRHLLGSAKRKAREFSERHPGLIKAKAARRARTFHEFDRAVIAPLYGFRDELDYYEKADCSPWLSRVRVKTLLLASEDDPIVPARVFPREEIEKSPWLTGVLSKRGGHVGFVSGRIVRSPGYWAEERAFAFLRERLAPGG